MSPQDTPPPPPQQQQGPSAGAADHLDLEITAGAQFKDRALEREFAEFTRKRDLLLFRRICAVLTLLNVVLLTQSAIILAMLAPTATALLLSVLPRTRGWAERRLRLVAFLTLGGIGGFLLGFAAYAVSPAARLPHEDRDPFCFISDFTWFKMLFIVFANVAGFCPGLVFVDLIILTAPQLPTLWAVAALNDDFPGLVHFSTIIILTLWGVLMIVFQNFHVSRRRTFFLVRRLRAENVVVRLSRESPLKAISGAFRATKTRSAKVVDAAAPPQPWMIDASQLDRSGTEQLGAGSFGRVVKAQWRGTTVAVKTLHAAAGDLRAQQDFQEEIALLFALRHPNVVLFMGVAVDAEQLLLVTEFVPDGSLADVLEDPGVQLTERTTLNFALETARGMQYLHGSEPPILHRDLKPQNLLVDGAHIKIADFGLSGDGGASTAAMGTAAYMPPEALAGEAMTQAGDVYSFGVCVNQMFSREDPYVGEQPMEAVLLRVATQGHRPTVSETMAGAVATLVRSCWAQAAAERPSFEHISQRLLEETKAGGGSDMQSVLSSVDALSFSMRLPSGQVAMVALDVAGMADRWTAAPQDTAKLCIRIGQAVRSVVISFKAYLARSEGGSYLVVLERPQDAMTVVEQTRRTLQGEASVQEDLRAGVHVGEALVDNGQYFGPTVARAVELSEKALGGEVAWSSEYELAHGSGRGVQDKKNQCWRLELGAGRRTALPRHPLPSLLSTKQAPFPWIMSADQIALDKMLGTGPIGEVQAGLLKDGTRVAVKRLHARRMNEAGRLEFLGQVGVLFQLRHRNIVSVLGAMLPPPSFCVVSALLGQSVREVLNGGATLSVSRVRADVSAGLAYLHGQSIVHGRLTSRNVIMAGGDGRLCVCDFGLRQVATDTMSLTQSVSFWWTAPEVLASGAAPTPASDVYSLAVVMWEAGTGREPYEHVGRMPMTELMGRIIGGERPPMHTGQFGADQAFMEAALREEPSERPSVVS